jgi:Xaa-Pro aminopeptidase
MNYRNHNLVSLHRERISRVISSLRDYGYDALLVFKVDNVRYVTNHRPMLFYPDSTFLRNAALITNNGHCILFVDGADWKRCVETYSWLSEEEIIPIAPGLDRDGPAKDFTKKVSKFLSDKHTVGLDVSSFNVLTVMTDRMPKVRFAEGNALMNAIRKIKGRLEIESLRKSAKVAESATQTAIRSLRIGIRECDVWAEACKTIYSLGAESTHSSGIVASGKNGTYPSRLATTRTIKKDEFVYLDMGACLNGYFSDMARTVITGRPSRDKIELYRDVLGAKIEMENALKSGNTTADVAEAGIRAFDGSRFSKYSSVIGHGVGMSLAELPLIRPRNDRTTRPEVLVPGMVVAMEPAIWHPKLGGVRLEDTYLVSKRGYEKLTANPSAEQLEQVPFN